MRIATTLVVLVITILYGVAAGNGSLDRFMPWAGIALGFVWFFGIARPLTRRLPNETNKETK